VAIRATYDALGNLGVQPLERYTFSHHYGDRAFLRSGNMIEFEHEHVPQAAVDTRVLQQMPTHDFAVSSPVPDGMRMDSCMKCTFSVPFNVRSAIRCLTWSANGMPYRKILIAKAEAVH
jgi:hypothetical protein